MNLTGVFVPLITPFDASGAVALDTLESLAHEVLDAGASGIVALGTTAEPSSLAAWRSAPSSTGSRPCAATAASR